MLDAKGIGKRIEKAREDAGFSKAELQKPLSISRQTLTAWEKGERCPGVYDLSKLCNLFGCDFGYIVGEYEEKTRPVTDIRAETGLSPEAIEVLQTLKKYSKGEELRLISDLIVFPVNDSILDTFGGFSGELLLQSLNDILHQFRLLPAEGIKKAGYFAILQRLFNDFIEEQLKKPFPVDEDEEE